MAAAWSGLETAANLFKDVFDGLTCSASLLFGAIDFVPTFDGGGDLSLGEVGHEGEFCPDLICLSAARALSSTPSTLLGCIIGLWADSARCTAAAEGTVESDPPTPAFLVGLNSWLFLRDRDDCGMADTLREFRAGEVSLEGSVALAGPLPVTVMFSEVCPDMTFNT